MDNTQHFDIAAKLLDLWRNSIKHNEVSHHAVWLIKLELRAMDQDYLRYNYGY